MAKVSTTEIGKCCQGKLSVVESIRRGKGHDSLDRTHGTCSRALRTNRADSTSLNVLG